MVMLTFVVPFCSLKLKSHSEPGNSRFSCSSAKVLYVLKLVFGLMEVYFCTNQRSCPSGLTIAKNLRPPSSKFITFVLVTKGLGPHHRSSNSAVVHASQTRSRPALNSRTM